MKKQELLQQLAAALVAAGLLTGVAAEGAAQDNQRGDQPSTAPTASRRPAAGVLYGIVVWEDTLQRGDSKKAAEMEKAADALIAYANTAEGKADMESDPEFKKLIEGLRAVKARLQKERARQNAPASQPASQPR